MDRRLCIRKILATPKFFEVFSKSLDDIFSNGWIHDIEGFNEIICSQVASIGWEKALKTTCNEVGTSEIYEYRDTLSGYSKDLLDICIAELLVAFVYDDNGQRITRLKT